MVGHHSPDSNVCGNELFSTSTSLKHHPGTHRRRFLLCMELPISQSSPTAGQRCWHPCLCSRYRESLLMNEHDRKNLEFLLRSEIDVIRDWAGKMDSDDIVYAQELLLQHAADLRERSREILVEAELARSRDYSQAQSVIDRIRSL